MINRFAILFVLVWSVALQAQLPRDSWSLNFGGSYPRFINHSFSWAGNANFGGYIGFQRNFSEHVGLRMQVNYVMLEGRYGTPEISTKVNSFSGNFDLIYYFVPCEPVTPYLVFGVGPNFYLLDSNRPNKALKNNYLAYQINGALGVDWSLDTDWKLRTELNYHTVADNKFDGVDGPSLGGLFGTPFKSYISIDIGFNYVFSKGEPSKYCQLYEGIVPEMNDMTNYNKIEEIVKANIPKEVIKEVAVGTSGPRVEEKWVLVGVNFDSNKSSFKIESYPILYDAAKTLLTHPNMKVEIQGYTDNVGSQEYNRKLSQKRADAVKDYLRSKGVSASRLTTIGMGESNPIAENKTADGRAMNRRIEFKVK